MEFGFTLMPLKVLWWDGWDLVLRHLTNPSTRVCVCVAVKAEQQCVLFSSPLPFICVSALRRRLISQRSSLETLEDIEENAPLRR